MSKRDSEKIEQLEEWRRDKEIEEAIREGISKRVRTVCMTAVSAIMGGFYWLGSIAYSKWAAFEAAIKAFLTVDRGGQ